MSCLLKEKEPEKSKGKSCPELITGYTKLKVATELII